MASEPQLVINEIVSQREQFHTAKRQGDVAAAQGHADKIRSLKSSLDQNTDLAERHQRFKKVGEEVEGMGFGSRLAGGGMNALKNAGRSLQQGATWATGGTPEEIAAAGAAEDPEQRLRESLIGQTNAGRFGEFATQAIPAAAGGIGVSALTKGLPLAARMGSQAALGAAELPIMMPTQSGEGYGGQKLRQALLGAGLGAGAEVIAPAVSGAARKVGRLGRGAKDGPRSPSAAGKITEEELVLDDLGYELADAQRVMMRTGETPQGVVDLVQAHKMRGFPVSTQATKLQELQGAALERYVNRSFGEAFDRGKKDSVTSMIAGKEKSLRSAEKEAWDTLNTRKDSIILDADELVKLSDVMEAAMREADPHAGLPGAENLMKIINRQRALGTRGDVMGVKGLQGLRSELNKYRPNPKNADNAEAGRMFGAVKNKMDDFLTETVDNRIGKEAAESGAPMLGRESTELLEDQGGRLPPGQGLETTGARMNPDGTIEGDFSSSTRTTAGPKVPGRGQVTDPDRAGILGDLRKAIKATSTRKGFVRGSKARELQGGYQDTELSKLIKAIDGGAEESAILRGYVGKGKSAKWRTLLEDVHEVAPELEDALSVALRDSAMNEHIVSKIATEGIEGEGLKLTGKGDFEYRIAGAIDKFLELPITKEGSGLFTKAERVELLEFARAIKHSTPPRSAADEAISQAIDDRIAREVGRLPSSVGSTGRIFRERIGKGSTSRKMEREIGFPEKVYHEIGESGGKPGADGGLGGKLASMIEKRFGGQHGAGAMMGVALPSAAQGGKDRPLERSLNNVP